MRKKIFLALCIPISAVFLISYLMLYGIFRNMLFTEISRQQSNLQKYNETIFASYIDSFNMVPFQLVNDENVSALLNIDSSKYLDMFLVREALRKEFNGYLNQQLFSANLDCRFILYLSEQIPLAAYCDSYSLSENIKTRTSQVYSSHIVSSEDWYSRTLLTNWSPYFFLNEETKELCYARCVWNYSLNDLSSEGIGVVVIAIPESAFVEKLSLDTLTNNSSVILSNEYDEILYSYGEVTSLPFSLLSNDQRDTSKPCMISGEKYMVNTASIENDLFLTFFTPYSDITAMVQKSLRIYLLFSALFFPVLIGILYLITRNITAPVISLAQLIGTIDDTRSFDIRRLDAWKDKELRILCRSFSELIQKENVLIERIIEENRAKRAAVLHALQAQINPHFLYNALDIVSWMALEKNEDTIADIVSSISNMMHYSISQPDALIPICSELDNIREFIRISQLERPGRIELIVNAPDDLLSGQHIPKFTLQPLAENGILHNPEISELLITISIARQGQAVTITVTDTGAGADPDKLNAFLRYEETDLPVSNGFGIRNVNERLQLHYGNESGLSYFRTEEGYLAAVVTIF